MKVWHPNLDVYKRQAIRSGADLECAREILACNTTDEALHVLDRYHILQKAMEDVTRHIQFYLDHRSYQQILLGAVIFSNEFGYLGQTAVSYTHLDVYKRQIFIFIRE